MQIRTSLQLLAVAFFLAGCGGKGISAIDGVRSHGTAAKPSGQALPTGASHSTAPSGTWGLAEVVATGEVDSGSPAVAADAGSTSVADPPSAPASASDAGAGASPADPSTPSPTDAGAAACPNAALAYVLDDTGTLHTFDPVSLTLATIGTPDCGHGPLVAQAMAIDRNATAWVLDSSADLYEIDTTNAACTPTSFDGAALIAAVGGAPSWSSASAGLAFALDAPSLTEESLYVGAGGTLARIYPTTFGMRVIGPLSGAPSSVAGYGLSGSSAGDLVGVFASATPVLGTIDKASGALASSAPIPGVSLSSAEWAFAIVSGTSFLFVADTTQAGATSDVLTLAPGGGAAGGAASPVLHQIGFRVVAAGQAPCIAP